MLTYFLHFTFLIIAVLGAHSFAIGDYNAASLTFIMGGYFAYISNKPEKLKKIAKYI